MPEEMESILNDMISDGCLEKIVRVERIRDGSDCYYIYGLENGTEHILYSVGFDDENNEWMINWDGDW